ncbi:FecR family protein [Lutibacter sp. Hel_I_33_5]|uniref:FecR family protein n=1 Tax=Lutibacter sp. Hel_I_33_5 TaxID=1566289 RepID=UPI0011A74707|nr:FecR family protein [Lutibacter sp. Hel_I_33_5]TVZ55993.1 FecR family protein [Lutibacter sp. Hel_I_33_5]
MEKHFSDDTFLARWISNDLSEEELTSFKKSKEYTAFNKINESAQKLEAPAYNKKAALHKIQQELHKENQSKVRRLIPTWMYSAAAVLIVALGLLFFMNDTPSEFQTGFGEQLAVVLPDNSKVQLNAQSQLEFNSKTWEEQREINLKGEAFFDVEKGKTFKVITAIGTVEVLGTEFNVLVNNNYFEVQCHEGSVAVKSSNHNIILKPGNAVRIVNSKVEEWQFSDVKPSWLQGESTFTNASLAQVIKALENQFNVSINSDKIDTSKKYTGVFSHKNLKVALKTVFTTMDILYTFKGDKTIVLTNKK